MKGKGCFAAGGSAGRMRTIGGMKIPAYGANKKVLDQAKGKTTGSKPMDGPEGGAASARLDRPGRKHGGRIANLKPKSKAKEGDGDEDDRGMAKGGFLSNIKKGALHKSLGVPAGEKIPEKKLEKAEASPNPTLRKRAVLAETMKHWKKG